MLLFSTILDINSTLTKDDFIRLVIKWNQGSPHTKNIIPDIVWNGERNIRFGEDGRWLAIEEYRNQDIIAVRYEKREDDGTIWDTDYVMNFSSMKLAVRLDRSYTADALDADVVLGSEHAGTGACGRAYGERERRGCPVDHAACHELQDDVAVVIDVALLDVI